MILESSLLSLVKLNPKKRWRAGNGGNSHKHQIFADPGEDQIINVPPGVTVYNDFGAIIGKSQ